MKIRNTHERVIAGRRPSGRRARGRRARGRRARSRRILCGRRRDDVATVIWPDGLCWFGECLVLRPFPCRVARERRLIAGLAGGGGRDGRHERISVR
jgi:hypothetical protein